MWHVQQLKEQQRLKQTEEQKFKLAEEQRKQQAECQTRFVSNLESKVAQIDRTGAIILQVCVHIIDFVNTDAMMIESCEAISLFNFTTHTT